MNIVTIGVTPLENMGETDEGIMSETIKKIFDFTGYMISSINLF